jgi:putative thioredoxin
MSYEIQNFEADVIERSRTVPVLVDFWAEWCGPCKMLGPVLERLAEKAEGRWILAKVDTDRHQQVAARFGIRAIPNVKLFIDGVPVEEFTGALPEHAVVQWLNKSLPHPLTGEIVKAEQAIAAGNSVEAAAVLEQVLHKDPGHEHARVLLAGTLLEKHPDRALELVRGIEEDSRDFPMADAIRTVAVLTEKLADADALPAGTVKQTYCEGLQALARFDHEQALQKFIAVIRADRYYDDDGARKACVAIFKMLGDEQEITRAYRREFSSALHT